METDGLQRLSVTHNKALNNDEANGCARRVHFTKLIMQIFEYYPFNRNNAVLVALEQLADVLRLSSVACTLLLH